jgi:hypothetical protein
MNNIRKIQLDMSPDRATFPRYNCCDLDYSNHQFLFRIIIYHMIEKKDPELFKFVRSELPFLVGSMFRFNTYSGKENIISNGYDHYRYRLYLEKNFGPMANSKTSSKSRV